MKEWSDEIRIQCDDNAVVIVCDACLWMSYSLSFVRRLPFICVILQYYAAAVQHDNAPPTIVAFFNQMKSSEFKNIQIFISTIFQRDKCVPQ